MKIAIVTFPLINNYGGILQAYALSRKLSEMGHQAALVRLAGNSYFTTLCKFLLKSILYLFSEKAERPILVKQNREVKKFIEVHFPNLTKCIYSKRQLTKFFNTQNFDLIIVGSDQVFAKMGYPGFTNIYSLDDAIFGNPKKVAYAASFGGDSYTGDPKYIQYHRSNLSKFEGVSVREASGIEICMEEFGVLSQHVVDPVLLLEPESYDEFMFHQKKTLNLFHYVLDTNTRADNLTKTIASELKLNITKIKDGNESTERASIEEWLTSIRNATYMVTDSFHGCVFAIMFNIPFTCIVNEQRGKDRFYSLLSEFGLLDRIDDDSFLHEINWTKVNTIRKKRQESSLNFLSNHL